VQNGRALARVERMFYHGSVRTFSDLRGQTPPERNLPLFDPSATVRRFDTPEFRGITFYEVQAKSILNHVPSAAGLPFEWTINVYRGCTHACAYCFARRTHTYLNFDAGPDFDSRIVVKVNAPEVLRRELRRPSWGGAHVAMGTNTDPYQRCEGRYRLTRAVVETLRDFANPFSILTKGTLILRDLDLLREAASVAPVGVSFSVGFVDETLWRSVEPGTPSPRRRLDAVRRFADAGFSVGVLMAPILPYLSDSAESIEETVAATADAGATSVTPLPLHLRPGAREWYFTWLERTHPELVPRYRELYQRGSYLAASYQKDVTSLVQRVARRHGLNRAAPGEARQVPTSPSEGRMLGSLTSSAGDDRQTTATPKAEQLTLL